jgi:hypothetical protein
MGVDFQPRKFLNVRIVRQFVFWFLCVFIVSFSCHQVAGQPLDETGSGRAILFDGNNHYVDLGNVYDDLALPVTISVWVKISPGATYAFPIFNSQDNLPLYNGVTFIVSSSAFSIQYGDGMGENDPYYRRGKSAGIPDMSGQWINLTGVMRSYDDMDLYLNGINMGGAYSGSSPYPMSSNSPLDNAKIGYWHSNGITTYFKGYMDELRIFNRSLSELEIREQMCKRLTGNETGLIGYWPFDELSGNILKDKSPNHFDGVLMGNPTRVFSGAPIGDISTNLYSASWPGESLKLDDIEVTGVTGNPEGVHIYKVNSVPSQTSGLDDVAAANPYYGVFIASRDDNNFFDVSKKAANICSFFIRDENSIPQWSPSLELKSVNGRMEIVRIIGEEIIFDLGVYRILCDQPSYLIQSGITDLTGKSFLWSTGETTPDISVTKSGLYSVDVSDACGTSSDTVNILFEKKPSFSLGSDETLCLTQPKMLVPYENSAGFNFKWQDGSTLQSFEVHNPGTYWVTVENICGASTDSVRIDKKEVEVADLGPDKIICDQISHPLATGIQDVSEKSFLWSTGQSTGSIEINKSGIYHVSVTSVCGIDRDTVNIIFLKKPAALDLGHDEELCVFVPKILKPYDLKDDLEFEWQDGTKSESLAINDFGVYWLTVKNACGVESDTVSFLQREADTQAIPNIITPNGDLLNQHFVIEKEIHGPNHLVLYNRWGEKVYSSDDYRNDWDGGSLPTGVYFYQAAGSCIGEKRGALTISR